MYQIQKQIKTKKSKEMKKGQVERNSEIETFKENGKFVKIQNQQIDFEELTDKIEKI